MAVTPSSGDIVIMGIDLNTINYWYVGYILFSIALVAGGAFSLYSSANLGRTVIYVIGCSLVMLFFGMRWFGNIPSTSNLWPPTINTCPDYLTYVVHPSDSTLTGCVDTLGVSANSSFPKITSSDLIAHTQTKGPGSSGTLFGGGSTWKAYTSADVLGTPAISGIVGVAASGNTPEIVGRQAAAAVPATAETVKAVCNACQTAGLTWEGVWDGDTCLALNRFTESLAMKAAAGCS